MTFIRAKVNFSGEQYKFLLHFIKPCILDLKDKFDSLRYSWLFYIHLDGSNHVALNLDVGGENVAYVKEKIKLFFNGNVEFEANSEKEPLASEEFLFDLCKFILKEDNAIKTETFNNAQHYLMNAHGLNYKNEYDHYKNLMNSLEKEFPELRK